MRLPGQGELRHKIIAKDRQHVWTEAVWLQPLEIDVMVRAVEMLQGQVRCVAPAVGFTGEKGHALSGGRRAHERRKVRRQ